MYALVRYRPIAYLIPTTKAPFRNWVIKGVYCNTDILTKILVHHWL